MCFLKEEKDCEQQIDTGICFYSLGSALRNAWEYDSAPFKWPFLARLAGVYQGW